jgi:hypothetical protein
VYLNFLHHFDDPKVHDEKDAILFN